MADNVDLQAKQREERGKNAARRLRASGMVPAVLYGGGSEAGGTMALAVPDKVVDYTLQHLGDNALYEIDLGSGGSTARIVDVHRDPVSGRLVHVDFAPVNMRERIEVTVPLHVVGESPGAEEGGVLQQVAYEVQIETLPGDIPQEHHPRLRPRGGCCHRHRAHRDHRGGPRGRWRCRGGARGGRAGRGRGARRRRGAFPRGGRGPCGPEPPGLGHHTLLSGPI